MTYVVHAEFLVKEDKIDYFKKIILNHANQSITKEKGCKVFDVCQSTTNKKIFFLYEVYINENEYFLRHYIKIGNRVKLKKQVVIKFSEFNLAFTIL